MVVEVELEDDSLRTARRYFTLEDANLVRLEAVGESIDPIEVPSDQVMIMGVIVRRLRFVAGEATPSEEPLPVE